MNLHALWIMLLVCGSLRAEVTLQAYGEISASAKDSLGDTMGGLGSAVAYDAKTDCVFMMPDRGASDGAIDYHPRCYRIKITPNAKNPKRLDARLEETILFRDQNGRPFTGLLPDSTKAPQRDGRRCLDPEALAIAPDGSLYVSDEYTPTLLHFDRSGKLLREFPLPDWFQPRDKKGSLNYRANSKFVSGRDKDRGVEAFGILPGGNRGVLILQSALVQDGGKSIGSARILVLDLRSGKPIAEYPYAFGDPDNPLLSSLEMEDLSVNDLAVINSHSFLVIERDKSGRSGPLNCPIARYKAVWLVDIPGATNLLQLPARPYDRFPFDPAFKPLTRDATVKFARKTLLFNLPSLLSQLDLPPDQLAAKWEGLALLPPKSNRAAHLIMAADNDFLNPTLSFGGKTTRFPRACDRVPTQFFEILVSYP